MSRDMLVYARRDAVPLEDVLATLERRGAAVRWRSRHGGTATARWRRGDLELQDEPGVTVSVSHEPVDDLMREEATAGRRLSAHQRRVLAQARTIYWVSGPASGPPAQARLLEAVLTTLAEAGDGIIVDPVTDEVRDPGRVADGPGGD